MKKLNNKGFAISGIMYTLLLLFILLVSGFLIMIASRKSILDSIRREILNKHDVIIKGGSWSFDVEVTAGSLDFGFAAVEANMVIDWGDGTETEYKNTGYPVKNYSSAGVKRITLKGVAKKISFCTTEDWGGCAASSTPAKLRDVVTEIPRSFGLTSASQMFSGTTFASLTAANFFDDVSRNITNTSFMFYGNPNFNQPINNWNTSKVTQMNFMFYGASSFNQPINNWDVSKVIDMQNMFARANSFNQALSSWDTSQVEDFTRMFFENTGFNRPLNTWDTSSATSMGEMFSGAITFNQDLSSWCVSNFPIEPTSFRLNTAATWLLPKPVWGTCP